MSELSASPLGKTNVYTDQYDSSLLFAICRDGNRVSIGVNIRNLPFKGVDIWNGFDFTWLDENCLAKFGVLTIYVPCESPNLIESKSLKLYLFSFANTSFKSTKELVQVVEKDLSAAAGLAVSVVLEEGSDNFAKTLIALEGESIDYLDISCSEKDVTPDLLQCDEASIVSEQLCSDLLKSNCLVTGNPDWGSVRITYMGPKIDHASLLKYIVSYRNHQGFHEQCVEQIYFDILERCKPTSLLVEGRYTRRGGLDINPVRASGGLEVGLDNVRLIRQ
jgi:7-cyano-7-deazaguanine reductase